MRLTPSFPLGTATHTVNVRRVPPPRHQPLIYSTLDTLSPAALLEIVSDHDPAPLYVEFERVRLGQLARGGVGRGRVAIAVAGDPYQTTRAALGQVVFADHPADRLALDLWG